MCLTTLPLNMSPVYVAPTRERIVPRRRKPVAPPVRSLVLAPEQSLRVQLPSGQTLLTLAWTDEGHLIQLGDGDVALQAIGKLSIDARELEFVAREGDVVVRGEKIRLN